MSQLEIITSCLNILRRLPPNDVGSHLNALVDLVPDAADELLQRVDQPLQQAIDKDAGRPYLLCEYNRDADSYRSPWSNVYEPPLEDAYMPGDQLRKLEMDANELFDAYRELYYQGGVSSVYLWDTEDIKGGFAGAFLLKKIVAGNSAEKENSWESIHVVQTEPDASGKRAKYKVTSTIMLSIDCEDPAAGDTSLSGTLNKVTEKTVAFDSFDGHLVNIGEMIEEVELDIRRNIDGVAIQKTRQILSSLRSCGQSKAPGGQGIDFTKQLNAAIGLHGEKRDGGLAERVAAMALARQTSAEKAAK